MISPCLGWIIPRAAERVELVEEEHPASARGELEDTPQVGSRFAQVRGDDRVEPHDGYRRHELSGATASAADDLPHPGGP